jgi:serpin B
MGVFVRYLAVLLLLLIAGCGGGPSRPGDQRPVPAEDQRALRAGNEGFAGRLYQALARHNQTFAFSPYSISVALGMTSAGARGPTLTELEHGMGFTLPQPRLHAAFGALGQELEDRQGVELDIANSLWGQAGRSFKKPFLDTLERAYDGGMQTVDYAADPEAARRRINEWVGAATHGKIGELLAQGTVTKDTRLALVNAVYFKAKWATAFDPGQTGEAPFHAPGGAVKVDFMHATEHFRYARGDGFQVVELPYRRDEIAMDVILPDRGRLAAVDGRVASGGIGRLLSGLAIKRVALSLPKLDFGSSFQLAPALRELGINLLFDHADLTGMTEDESLAVSQVAHKATFKVDERGTEAAAATAVIGAMVAEIGPTVAMNVDRPFLVAVRDRASGQILFLARVLDPAASA